MKKIFITLSVVIAIVLGWFLFVPVNYYEYEVVDASECLPGEIFDDEYSVCYFDFYCETEEECEVVDLEFDRVLRALDSLSEKAQLSNYGNDNKKKEIESFMVSPEGDIVLEAPTQEVRIIKSAWEVMKTILPPDHRVLFGEYVEWTDGKGGELASVEPLGDGSVWKLSVDPKDTYNPKGEIKNMEELVATLVHEYAHVLTLNNTQQRFTSQTCSDEEFETFEGCAFVSSYLNIFVQRFWSDYLDEFFEIEEGGSEDDIYEFYLRNKNDFVTEYAATNPEEDISETFAFFVTGNRTAGGLISDQKLNFFYDYPEMVELRTYMRGRIAHLLSQ